MQFDPTPQHKLSSNANDVANDVELPVEESTPGPRAIPAVVASVEVELTHWKDGYTQQQLDDPRIHATRITPQQAVALKLLTTSLNEQAARMANGRFVQNAPDALRYLLDQLVEQVPAELMTELEGEI